MAKNKIYKQRIERGFNYWKQENEDKFSRFKRYLRAKHYSEEKESRDRVTVPYIHTIIRTKLPAIFIRNPKFLITAAKKLEPQSQGIGIAEAQAMQGVMDYIPEEIGMEQEIERTVLDYIAFGKGVAKIGYQFEMADDPENPSILVDRFFVERVAYSDGCFVIDPEAKKGLKDARWVAEKHTYPLDDIKKNKFYKNTSDLQPNVVLKDELRGNKKPQDDEKRVEVWEYWQKDRFGLIDKHCIVYVGPDNVDDTRILHEAPGHYKHGDWPYEEMNNYEIPDYLFPMGDIEPIETQQQELDTAETLLITHMKRFVQKYKAKKGTLDSKAISAIESPENTVVELDDLSNLEALSNPAVNQTVPLSTNTIKEDLTQISGVSEYQRGVMPTGERTLGEAQMVQGGAMQRSDSAVRDVEKFVANIGRKLMQTVQQFITDDMLIKINGDGSNAEDWMNVSPEDIQGEYSLDVQPQSTIPENKDQRKKQFLDLYTIFSQDPSVNTEPLKRKILNEYDIKEVEEVLGGNQMMEDPMMEEEGGNLPQAGLNGPPIGSKISPEGY